MERLGPFAALKWFVTNMPRYEKTHVELGIVRAQLLCLAISLFNGCSYCVYGISLSFELLYFRETGKLFPISERDFMAMARNSKPMRPKIAKALAEAGLSEELEWYDRVHAVWQSAVDDDLCPSHVVPKTDEDPRLLHLVTMFAVLNSCGIVGLVPPDQAHNAVNKETVLKNRYFKLREEELNEKKSTKESRKQKNKKNKKKKKNEGEGTAKENKDAQKQEKGKEENAKAEKEEVAEAGGKEKKTTALNEEPTQPQGEQSTKAVALESSAN